MPFAPLIEMVLPKCKVTMERKGNVRSTLGSLWGYPLVFKSISQLSCCVGVEALGDCKGCWLASGRGGVAAREETRVFFPVGRPYDIRKGLRLPPCRGRRDRRDTFKGKGTSVSPVEKAVPRARAAQGYVHGSSLLLLVRQRVLVALEAKEEGKKKKWLRYFRYCMPEGLWYMFCRPAGGVIRLQITCL